jgi:hypothetical protein
MKILESENSNPVFSIVEDGQKSLKFGRKIKNVIRN